MDIHLENLEDVSPLAWRVLAAHKKAANYTSRCVRRWETKRYLPDVSYLEVDEALDELVKFGLLGECPITYYDLEGVTASSATLTIDIGATAASATIWIDA